MTSRYWKVAAAGLAILLAFAAVSCGGSGTDDEAAVSGVVADAVLSDDEQALCGEILSERLVEEVYGDLEACLQAEAPDEGDGVDPDEVVVSEIEIAGDTATATVAEIGGDTDGANGSVRLVLVDDSWRLDERGIDYLRSILDHGLLNEEEYSEEEHGPLADEGVRDCFKVGMFDLSDEEFRQIAYDSMADREPSEAFISVLAGCMEQR